MEILSSSFIVDARGTRELHIARGYVQNALFSLTSNVLYGCVELRLCIDTYSSDNISSPQTFPSLGVYIEFCWKAFFIPKPKAPFTNTIFSDFIQRLSLTMDFARII